MDEIQLIIEFIKHNPSVARGILESYLQTVGDNERHDRLRLAIEFFCDPVFREKLQDFSFNQTYRKF